MIVVTTRRALRADSYPGSRVQQGASSQCLRLICSCLFVDGHGIRHHFACRRVYSGGRMGAAGQRRGLAGHVPLRGRACPSAPSTHLSSS